MVLLRRQLALLMGILQDHTLNPVKAEGTEHRFLNRQAFCYLEPEPSDLWRHERGAVTLVDPRGKSVLPVERALL